MNLEEQVVVVLGHHCFWWKRTHTGLRKFMWHEYRVDMDGYAYWVPLFEDQVKRDIWQLFPDASARRVATICTRMRKMRKISEDK